MSSKDNKISRLSAVNPKVANLITNKLDQSKSLHDHIFSSNNSNIIKKQSYYNIKNTKTIPCGNLVSIRLRNGLGNRIFQVLAALGYAEKYDKELVICKGLCVEGQKPHEQNLDNSILRIFPNLKYVNNFSNYITIQESEYFKYNLLPESKSNVFLSGYFQCPEYFPSNIPIIRTSYYENTYFIHIRAGDYLQHPGEWGIDLMNYYKECIKQINKPVKYLVFSNDNGYARNIMNQLNISFTICNKTDPVDSLIEMANCSGGICVNSTFGWLGGLFQGDKRGKIFMPSIWNKLRDSKGIYPNWATIINVNNLSISQDMNRELLDKNQSILLQHKSMAQLISDSQRLSHADRVSIILEARKKIPSDIVIEEVNDNINYMINIHDNTNQPAVLMRQEMPGRLDIKTNILNRARYNLSDVKIVNVSSGRHRNYNACIIDSKLFFRALNVVEQDEIIVSDFNINTLECVPNTIKTLSLYSKFNNKHVEDPRVIFHKGNIFVCYTDGYNVAIAKLDANCNTIYSHYLKKPNFIIYEEGDGREKNWLPISMGDTIHFWYSDKPRTFLVYEDTGTSLEYKSYIKTEQRIRSNFGNIRGGCCPIAYDNERDIWFFHTFYEKKYRIGAYLTKGLEVVSITPLPILTGDHIVFPCGAIQYNGDFYISMGVQDNHIGILKVSKDLVFVPV